MSRVLYLSLIPMLWKGRKVKLALEDLPAIPEDQKVAFARRRLEDALKNTRSVVLQRSYTWPSRIVLPVQAAQYSFVQL